MEQTQLFTILTKAIARDFSPKDASYMLKEILDTEWENLSIEDRELLIQSIDEIKSMYY